MYRSTLIALAFLAVVPSVGFAQRPYIQMGGGLCLGAATKYEDGVRKGATFAFGLQSSRAAYRLDARVFDTPEEHLVTLGLAAGITSRPAKTPHLYLLGAAGGGVFAEEGDPANYIGGVLGLVAGRRSGFLAELRYDYLISDFTYNPSRSHHLASAIVGLRLGGLGP